MGLKSTWPANRRYSLFGAGLSVLVGFFLWWSPLGDGLVNRSYDFPFAFGPNLHFRDVALISMDEESMRELKQDYAERWDRRLHARLVDRLTEDGAKAVVFDVFFSKESSSEADEALARSINANRRVLLAADIEHTRTIGVSGQHIIPPCLKLRQAASDFGLTGVGGEMRTVIRTLYAGNEVCQSLPWAAAALVGANLPTNRVTERWLNYYGPGKTFDTVSYHLATNRPAGYFKDKVVFIGGRPSIVYLNDTADVFHTPYFQFEKKLAPGMEIMALSFCNLTRGDWLNRWPAGWELAAIVLSGALFGWTLCLVRPLPGVFLAILAALATALIAVVLVWQRHAWFPWLILAAAQIPCAYLWSLIAHYQKLQRARAPLPVQPDLKQHPAGAKIPASPPVFQPAVVNFRDNFLPPFEESRSPSAVAAPACDSAAPRVPDYSLLRIVAEGGYGKVWLAVDAIDTHKAVKIVDRKSFDEDTPFEREFKGVQKFAPISLNHPGWVRVLHVGRNPTDGYFYYVMEVGDDESRGQKIIPDLYKPRNLRSELEKKQRLPFAEFLELALKLTSALEFLHRHKLVHRDIKPSNIIYVNGEPKFADIGLVTEMGTQGHLVSWVGTSDYIPNEGPGLAPADVFGLGKVLFAASLGLSAADTSKFPDWVRQKNEENSWLLQLYPILDKACKRDVAERYQSATDLHTDLLHLQRRYQTEQKTRT